MLLYNINDFAQLTDFQTLARGNGLTTDELSKYSASPITDKKGRYYNDYFLAGELLDDCTIQPLFCDLEYTFKRGKVVQIDRAFSSTNEISKFNFLSTIYSIWDQDPITSNTMLKMHVNFEKEFHAYHFDRMRRPSLHETYNYDDMMEFINDRK